MKTKGKAWQLVLTVLLIAAFVYTAFFGVAVKYGDVTTTYIKGAKDIRFGVDIKGGVNVTFVPSDGYDATDDQLEAAQLVIENRLVALNVTDYELYVDNNSDSLILEFPWQSGETEFDPEAAIEEIGTTAYLTFREGSSADGALVLDGSMVESAAAQYGPVNGSSSEYYVALKFTDEGAKAFGDATTRLYQSGGSISIWLDDENVSTASVNAAITDGSAIITSSAANPFTQEDVVKMARQINSGSLPFALSVDSYSTISPSLGENSLSAMVLAGVIAFALILVLMTALYRLPGFLACIALAGQVAATLAFVSGYFPVFESFTLTLPGIAGIILAIGMGVDANVITAERIKEELRSGKSLECPGMESAEIHSMAMEFLTAPWHHLLFGKDTDKYALLHAEDSFLFLAYGCAVDEFQHIMYQNPDLTPDQRNQTWLELEHKYRPWIDFDNLPFYGRGAGWQRQLHIYECPFYYIDYCLSTMAALQFFLLSLHDQKDAWERYLRLVRRAGTASYTELCETAGLQVPFRDGSIKAIAQQMSQWIAEHQV